MATSSAFDDNDLMEEMHRLYKRKIKAGKEREAQLLARIRELEQQPASEKQPTKVDGTGQEVIREPEHTIEEQLRLIKLNYEETTQILRTENRQLMDALKYLESGVQTRIEELNKTIKVAVGGNEIESNRLRVQVADLRRTNEDLNASIAQAIKEKERAVKQIAELQTRIHDLEDNNRKLKEANELVESERNTIDIPFQREKPLYEARIAALQHVASCAGEDARRKQQAIVRKLQEEIVALNGREKQAEELLKTNTAALESTRKKVEDLEAGQLTMTVLLNEKNQEIDRLKDDLRRANSISRGFNNASSSTFMNPSAVEGRKPVAEYRWTTYRGRRGGAFQRRDDSP